MLAQNFKTAADLGITEVEVQSLIKVLGMLERGELARSHFDMSRLVSQTSCGTVGCICGWAFTVSKGLAFPEVATRDTDMIVERMPQAAVELFAIAGDFDPKVSEYKIWSHAGPAQAALALRSYLTTGDARWDLALAE